MPAISDVLFGLCLASIQLTSGVLHHGSGHHGHHSSHDSTPSTPPVDPVDNMAYLLTQGKHCLDVYQDASTLILYDCHGYYQANQEFIWRKDPGMTSHFVYTTALDGSCLTIDGHPDSMPDTSSPAHFRPCDPNNTNALWDYDFANKRLTLSQYPHLCLDYHQGWTSNFAIYECQSSSFNMFGPDTQYNEVINFEIFNFHYDSTPHSPLIHAPQDNGTYLMTYGTYCLDFHVDGDQIVLYKCNLQVNQEFQWRSAGDDVFQIFTAVQGGKCLSVDGAATQKPDNGAKITFRPCSETDASQSWTYDSQRKMLRSGAWNDLCADFMDAGMLSFSSDRYAIYTCKGPHEDPDNQVINIETIPGQYAPFVVQDFDLPSGLSRTQTGPGVLGMSGMAAFLSVVVVTGVAFVAWRSRRGVGARDAAEDLLEVESPVE